MKRKTNQKLEQDRTMFFGASLRKGPPIGSLEFMKSRTNFRNGSAKRNMTWIGAHLFANRFYLNSILPGAEKVKGSWSKS